MVAVNTSQDFAGFFKGKLGAIVFLTAFFLNPAQLLADEPKADLEQFRKAVKPMKRACVSCHGPEKQKGNSRWIR